MRLTMKRLWFLPTQGNDRYRGRAAIVENTTNHFPADSVEHP